jgi:hypothetical protein
MSFTNKPISLIKTALSKINTWNNKHKLSLIKKNIIKNCAKV